MYVRLKAWSFVGLLAMGVGVSDSLPASGIPFILLGWHILPRNESLCLVLFHPFWLMSFGGLLFGSPWWEWIYGRRVAGDLGGGERVLGAGYIV